MINKDKYCTHRSRKVLESPSKNYVWINPFAVTSPSEPPIIAHHEVPKYSSRHHCPLGVNAVPIMPTANRPPHNALAKLQPLCQQKLHSHCYSFKMSTNSSLYTIPACNTTSWGHTEQPRTQTDKHIPLRLLSIPCGMGRQSTLL